MVPVVDVIHSVLLKVGTALFDMTFVFVVLVMYFIYKRNSQIAYHSLTPYNYDVPSQLIQVTLQGILAGIIGSLIITFLGLPIRLTPYFGLLLPIAIMLSFINMRYLCFSYSAAILGLLDMALIFINDMGIVAPELGLNPSGLIALVGVLHLMEALLIYIGGADNSIPIVVRKKDTYAVGYIMQKFWPLPFAMLILSNMLPTNNVNQAVSMPNWWPLLESNVFSQAFMYGLLPITAALGYSNVAVSTYPEVRAKKTSIYLFFYSIYLLAISLVSVNSLGLQLLGLITMPVIHELIIILDQKKEAKKDPFITLPKRGVRVVSVVPDGHAEQMGIESGDIIRKINDIEVINYMQMRAILKNYFNVLWVEVEKPDGKRRQYEYKYYPEGVGSLNIVHLPEHPPVSYNIKELQDTRSFLDFILKKV